MTAVILKVKRGNNENLSDELCRAGIDQEIHVHRSAIVAERRHGKPAHDYVARLPAIQLAAEVAEVGEGGFAGFEFTRVSIFISHASASSCDLKR